MLVRAAVYSSLILGVVQLCAAGDKDHLRRGEPELKYDYDVKYNRAVRRILSRGWKSDVVLRTVALPPFNPEAVLGLLRSKRQYSAFVIRPSAQIWETASGFGASQRDLDKRLSSIRPVFILVQSATCWLGGSLLFIGTC